jgi:hypothetical protein
MHDLQLVGVHDDGEHLVLTGGDGQRYRVRIDEPMRAAVRRDRARLGQLQIQTEGWLRPRDIQARIRAGETAEQVAAGSGVSLEHVRRYEGPVLAERGHVAGLARRLPARQVPERPEFGELVAERLTARGVPAESAAWDAWRREAGTWTVQLAFQAGSKDRVAQWTFDVQRSHLEPLDDEARWLSAATGDEGDPVPGRRLAAVSERVYDVEADGGVRAAQRRRARRAPQPGGTPQPEPDDAPENTDEGAGGARTLELLDALRGRRGRRQPVDEPVDEPLDEPSDEPGGLFVEQDVEPAGDDSGHPLPPAAHPPASRPHETVDAGVLDLSEGAVAVAVEESRDGAPDEPAPVRRRPSKSSKSRRASVPSWDDIVFGAKRE